MRADGMHLRVLREPADGTSRLFFIIMVMETREVPDEWRRANVATISKMVFHSTPVIQVWPLWSRWMYYQMSKKCLDSGTEK